MRSVTGITSAYFCDMSNRLTLWEVAPRSYTQSKGTATLKLSENASTTVPRTHPLVVHPVTTTVSTARSIR